MMTRCRDGAGGADFGIQSKVGRGVLSGGGREIAGEGWGGETGVAEGKRRLRTGISESQISWLERGFWKYQG